jgi:hypothetical protein
MSQNDWATIMPFGENIYSGLNMVHLVLVCLHLPDTIGLKYDIDLNLHTEK